MPASELVRIAGAGAGTRDSPGAQAELTRRLFIAIGNLNESTSTAANKLGTLTAWLVGLAVLTAFLTIMLVVVTVELAAK